MAKLRLSDLPEHREWGATIARGIEAEEVALDKLLRRVEQDGDEQDIYQVLFEALTSYCRYGAREKVLEVLGRIDSMTPPPLIGCEPVIANALLFHLRDPALAERQVRRGWEWLDLESDPAERALIERRLRNLELAIYAARDPESEEVRRSLSAIAVQSALPSLYDEALLAALRVLIPAGGSGDDIQGVLETAWANLAVNVKLHGYGNIAELEEVESLWRLARAKEVNAAGS